MNRIKKITLKKLLYTKLIGTDFNIESREQGNIHLYVTFSLFYLFIVLCQFNC